MRSSYIPNTNPSESCIPKSGLRREKVFLKGARHRRRLCPVEPHIQQRPLYCTQAWPRASSERMGVHRDESVLRMLFVTVHTIASSRSSEGQSPWSTKKRSLRQCAGKTLGTPSEASGHQVRLLSRCSGAIEITGVGMVVGA